MSKGNTSCRVFLTAHSCSHWTATYAVDSCASQLGCPLTVKQKDSSQETVISLMGYVHPEVLASYRNSGCQILDLKPSPARRSTGSFPSACSPKPVSYIPV